MPESMFSKRRITAAERRKKAFELRKAGASYMQIGEELGVTHVAAWKMVKKVFQKLESKTEETASEVREIEVKRIDQMFLSLWDEARKGDRRSIDTCLKIMQRRAKLLGLDAPTKMQIEDEIEKNGEPNLSEFTDEELETFERLYRKAFGED